MILTRSMHSSWLSNTWVAAAGEGREAIVVDAGAPVEPLVSFIEQHGLRPRLVLLTHHHVDHISEAAEFQRRYGAEVCVHEAEAELVAGCDRQLAGGETLEVDGLRVETLHIPGHTRGQLAFLVPGQAVFTGDTLFKGSIGGTRGPAHTTFEDLRRSLLEVLFALPHELRVLPGHTDETTLAAEWEQNPFIRVFRGLEEPGDEPCTAFGHPATLLVWARDYDGGHKAWVRFADGTLDVVPGSGVQRGS